MIVLGSKFKKGVSAVVCHEIADSIGLLDITVTIAYISILTVGVLHL